MLTSSQNLTLVSDGWTNVRGEMLNFLTEMTTMNAIMEETVGKMSARQYWSVRKKEISSAFQDRETDFRNDLFVSYRGDRGQLFSSYTPG